KQLMGMPERFNKMLLTAGAPMLSAAHGGQNLAERDHLFYLMTSWSVAASLPLILFLLLFAPDVLALYGGRFAGQGTLPLQALVAAQFVSLLCGPVGSVAMMSGLERHCLVISVVCTALSTALLVALVPWWGLLGAALTIVVAVIVLNLALVALVWR